MECTGTPVDDLQRRRQFIVKHFIISTWTYRPDDRKNSHPNKHSKLIIDTVQPIPKDIGHTAWGIKGRCYLDDRPYRPREPTLEEEVFNCLIMMIVNTTLIPMPVPFCKIVFG
jgi:hypothetical protein